MNEYFDWLCRIGRGGGEFSLLHALRSISFFSLIPHDENRSKDGLFLRWEFMRTVDDEIPCTMLEMLVALAEDIAYELQDLPNERDVSEIFWEMLYNIGLEDLDDDCFFEVNGRYFVEEAVQRVIDRTYGPNGEGGLFPLRHNIFDQRQVELWYQAQSYISENYLNLG